MLLSFPSALVFAPFLVHLFGGTSVILRKRRKDRKEQAAIGRGRIDFCTSP